MNKTLIFNPFDEDEKNRRKPVFWFILGLGGLCLFGYLMLIVYLYKPDPQFLISQYLPSPTVASTQTPNPTPTPTTTYTATPDVFLTSISQVDPVFKDDFSSNQYNWLPHYDNNTVLVENGTLSLRSNETKEIGVSTCAACPLTENTFYFQGDVSLQENEPKDYGIAFCLRSQSYYAFSIHQGLRRFGFYKHSSQGWEILTDNMRSTLIERFPKSNTLGVFFDNGKINLYINNMLVYSYLDDKPHKCGKLGFFVNGGKLTMLADNVMVYEIPTTSSPTPQEDMSYCFKISGVSPTTFSEGSILILEVIVLA